MPFSFLTGRTEEAEERGDHPVVHPRLPGAKTTGRRNAPEVLGLHQSREADVQKYVHPREWSCMPKHYNFSSLEIREPNLLQHDSAPVRKVVIELI